MHLRPNGVFDVAPSETITFTVTRKDPQNKATFAPKGFASGSEKQPDPQTKIWTGSAPSANNAQCTMTITFDFTGNTPGTFNPDDKYFIEIEGDTGLPVNDTVNAGPIVRERYYTFEVTLP